MTARAVESWTLQPLTDFVREASVRLVLLMTPAGQVLAQSGFSTRFQLYTVPGQVYYNATRRLVLQGADGVVFVGDSQARQLDENLESLQNLQSNLLEHGVDIRTIPLVLQYNKQDLPRELILSPADLDDALNFRGVPSFSADALHGKGVFETLKGISELVLKKLAAGTAA